MTTLDRTAPTPNAIRGALRLAPALYAATLFLSALLLFVVQPMFTKMVLPQLGGSPTVWSVAMVFFQGALLAGYAYAHLLVRRLSLGAGALIHLGVLALAAASLPIAVAQGFGASPTDAIALWLIALFAASLGLPFVALAASAPLLQGWFAATGHVRAQNPYVLYAASNLGSFGALLAYPVIIEPFLTLKTQAEIWSAGFAALAVHVTVAGLFVARQPSPSAAVRTERASWPARVRWAALSAIPSGLVIAVTASLTTDIAAAPFLWVVPLALYLLTFVAVFRDRPWLAHNTVARLVPIVIAPLAIGLFGRDHVFWLAMVIVNLLAFLLLALLCHGELYRRRPAPALLTEFYLWVSLGGVIGGIFAALIAPNIFTRIYEYPILLAAGVMVLPGMFAGGWRSLMRDAAPVLAVAALAVGLQAILDIRLPASAEFPFQAALVTLAALMLLQRHRPACFLALVVLAFVVTALWQPGFNRIETARSFFGVHQVVETADRSYRLLYHGTTLHGAERIDATAALGRRTRPEPLTYYHLGGAIAQAIVAVRGARGQLGRVAVVGLGTGSLACHIRGGEHWTFFEIDADVVRIARDPRLFSFISSCAPQLPVVIGDARLTLAASPERYDLIVLDAFSSDVIPVHLLTREAVAGYVSRLNPGGALVMHISNRHMELNRVVAAVAAAEGLVAYVKEDQRPEPQPFDYKMNAIAAALARAPADLGDLPSRDGWREMKPDPGVRPWTDDFSDILAAILRKKLGS